MNTGDFDSILTAGTELCPDRKLMEFHVSAKIRRACGFEDALFASSGNVIFANVKAVQLFAQKYNKTIDGTEHPERYLKSGQLNAMGLIDEIFHYVCRMYRQKIAKDFFAGAASAIEKATGKAALDKILVTFTEEFPPTSVYRGKMTVEAWLAGNDADGTPNRFVALEELMMLRLANENPAFEPFFPIFEDTTLLKDKNYLKAWDSYRTWSAMNPPFGPEGRDLVSMLKAPVEYSPYDLKGQLAYIRTHWQTILGEWLARLLAGLDLIAEEEKPGWGGGFGAGGLPDMSAYEFGDISKEYERFSPDRDWMPNVVLMAKSALVWLDQLSKKYGRPITRLDQIPDEELDFLASAGFTGLWLIGLWERSKASARIKQICGNPEAAASAYSLDDYEIADELGGWGALDNLRARAWKRGIRMASDMVPNHTGMDANWVVEKPDLFVQTRDCPFPGYDFNGENLSHDGRVGVYLENHYYSKSDCAVVFKRVDNATGDTRYIYHGNDGTGMPWNDTAQIDFLNPAAREEVIQKILHVARNFPIIRFDAAMVLAKKHIQRLWYPEPGKGGDIASRSRFSITRDEFERRIPEEFWREVVDRCAREVPDTLLLAEAFWMMEGYFVRTLGMHRVYNSAFMNMLKKEENAKYRTTIKNTIEFDPEILRRYVNFMNNPDEETAVAQFGRDDKYFGVCTMMVAMPGLPMFGHGQIEGFEEKYGMEYRRAYRDETVNEGLVERHRREIFPLMKRRWLFAGVENFRLYDFWENGRVNENVFVWSNRVGQERALIFYNNKYEQASGWIKTSAAFLEKHADGSKELVQRTLAEGIGLSPREGRFCLMQEQRSRLWYIRETTDIANNGLFAHLNGFQTQVFVNIREVDDDAGFYRALCDSLAGRGITDVHMGIQNIRLKELYATLARLATPEYFQAIRKIIEGETEEREALFVAIKKPAKDFFDMCETFIAGNYGALSLTGMAKRKRPANCDDAWNRLKASIERLTLLGDQKQNGDARTSQAARKLVDEIGEKILARKEMPEVLGAALILYALRDIVGTTAPGATASELVELWSLDRKLADMLTDSGLDGENALRDLQQFGALYCLADPVKGAKQNRVPAIIEKLLATERVRALLGVHEWDGVEWFNKEKAEELVEFAITGACIGGTESATADKDLESLYKTKAAVLTLIADSGYRIDGIPGMKSGQMEPKAKGKVVAKKDPPKRPAAKSPKAGKSTNASATNDGKTAKAKKSPRT